MRRRSTNLSTLTGPKRVQYESVVNFESTIVEPQASIRVLGLHIDSKLKWGAHMNTLKSKMTTQELVLKMIAASTWRATLQKARTVYSAVIRLGMTFATKIWHQPDGRNTSKRVTQLSFCQNRCLRTITGAFKLTPVQVLEAEANIPNIKIQLDNLVLQSLLKRGIHPITQQGCRRVQEMLQKPPRTAES